MRTGRLHGMQIESGPIPSHPQQHVKTGCSGVCYTTVLGSLEHTIKVTKFK